MKNYIILDRSGSMQTRWDDTLGALTGFIDALRSKDKVSLLAFDSKSKDMVFDCAPCVDLNLAQTMSDKQIFPRGGTPLYDAMGVMNEHIFHTFKEGKKATVTILTDGHENASFENNRKTAKAMVESWKKRGMDVSFIGADFDNFAEGRKMGIGYGDTISVSSANVGEVAATMTAKATRYRAGENTAFTDEERRKTK